MKISIRIKLKYVCFLFSILYLNDIYRTIITNSYSINAYFNYKIKENLVQAIINSKDFVFYACNGILTRKIPEINNENPEISVVIPMFNAENFIHRAIISIENQNFSDFEIIIVNDYSTDNSYKIINKLGEYDNRIKIINNKRTMGTLYSRCIGTLSSKGKYILPLDNDDLFLSHDTLFSIYVEEKKNKPDILKFRGIMASNINDFFNNTNLKLFRDNVKDNHIIYQPTIAKNSYKQCILWGSSYNSELYKKVINLYGKKYFFYHITTYEDCIINYFIHQLAKSCEEFVKIGYLYIFRQSSASHSEKYINQLKAEIYYIEILYEHSNIAKQNKLLAIRDLYIFTKNKAFNEILDDKIVNKTIRDLKTKIILDKTIPNSNKTFLNNF